MHDKARGTEYWQSLLSAKGEIKQKNWKGLATIQLKNSKKTLVIKSFENRDTSIGELIKYQTKNIQERGKIKGRKY